MGLVWGFLKSSAIILAGIGPSAYLTGLIYHQTYLYTMNTDAGLFKKSSEDTLILGLVCAIEIIKNFMTWFLANQLWAHLVTAILGIFFLYGIRKRKQISFSVKDYLQRRKDSVLAGFLSAAVVGGLPFALTVVGLGISMPFLIGKHVGLKVAAARKYELNNLACDKQNLQYFSIYVNEQFARKGFLISSSTTHIAFFDSNKKYITTIERTGTEFRGEMCVTKSPTI
jgi:hypothetical protein